MIDNGLLDFFMFVFALLVGVIIGVIGVHLSYEQERKDKEWNAALKHRDEIMESIENSLKLLANKEEKKL